MVVIVEMLEEISFDQFIAEFENLSYQQITIALVCTAASYLVLSGYDWMALRYLRLSLPFPTVALATFCSCAISYNVGINLISGGSVRIRMYVAAGLKILDVVRITFFGMIAFTVGTSVVAAISLCFYPELIANYTGISATILLAIGLTTLGLCIIFLILTAIRSKPIRLGKWKFRLPSIQVTLSQLLISVVDMIFAGGCLYILISEPNVPFIGFLIVYSLSFIAGMISHVPGGLGIFDGILLFSFSDVIPAESMAAALVVYRIAYYLIPLIIATAILAIREISEFSNALKAKT